LKLRRNQSFDSQRIDFGASPLLCTIAAKLFGFAGYLLFRTNLPGDQARTLRLNDVDVAFAGESGLFAWECGFFWRTPNIMRFSFLFTLAHIVSDD
jgi:hypothetical protein